MNGWRTVVGYAAAIMQSGEPRPLSVTPLMAMGGSSGAVVMNMVGDRKPPVKDAPMKPASAGGHGEDQKVLEGGGLHCVSRRCLQ